MKLLGAILIMTAASLGGVLLLREKKQRQDGDRSLAAALELLRGELSSGVIPLDLGIERAYTHAKGIGKAFLSTVRDGFHDLGEHSFEEIWDKALADTCPWLALDTQAEIRKLGGELGRFDLELQLRFLDACISYLKEQWQLQRSTYPSDRRVTLGLSFSLSALLVILLY